MLDDQTIGPLTEALRVSPDNVPLRLHLADTLLRLGRGEDAEQAARAGLARPGADDDGSLKLLLARAFHQQGRHSQAAVVLEGLLAGPAATAAAHVLYARLLLGEGKVQQAVHHYRTALDKDPAASDEELSRRLGVHPGADDEAGGEVVDGRVRQSAEGGAAGPDIACERPRVSFRDVGGMETVKEEVRMKIIHPLQHAELFRAYGKSIGGGILLYGPPGCGKTHLARATAGEIQAGFLAVGINDVLEMWIGNSERNLHELFEQARRNRPCVLFFDEVDALAASRVDMRTSAGRHLINQFLAELDGVERSNEGVLVLAATNAPWHIDAAFRRPGR